MKVGITTIDWEQARKLLASKRLIMLAPSKDIRMEDLESVMAGAKGIVYLCDAYLQGAEKGSAICGGYAVGSVHNIDHHAPTRRMQWSISSTPLAIEYVSNYSLDPSAPVVINHLDCDSFLSAAIMLGALPPLNIFGWAAIAADHTGKENPIADLLQSAQKAKDPLFSLRQLQVLLTGEGQYDPSAVDWLQEHRQERHKARKLIDQSDVKLLPSGLAWVQLEERTESAFWPALLPQAKLFLFASPLANGNTRISLRLGMAAPQGAAISQLGISEFDPHYGGRWNAGANNRAGGTNMSLEQYIAQLDQRLTERF